MEHHQFGLIKPTFSFHAYRSICFQSLVSPEQDVAHVPSSPLPGCYGLELHSGGEEGLRGSPAFSQVLGNVNSQLYAP